MTTWVLVANSAEAYIYSVDNLRKDKLEKLKDFYHPDSRKKVTDLVTDRPGHFKIDSGTHGAFAKGNPKENEAEHFALQLIKELKVGHDAKKYFSLVIITPSHFYNHFKKHLNFTVEDLKHIPKDYTKYDAAKLLSSIREHLIV